MESESKKGLIAYPVEGVDRPRARVLTNDSFRRIKEQFIIREVKSQPVDKISIKAEYCSSEKRNRLNYSIETRRSFSPMARPKSFFFSTSNKNNQPYQRDPEKFKTHSSKLGWKCAVLGKDINKIREHLDELSANFSRSTNCEHHELERILEDINKIQSNMENVTERSTFSKCQRKILDSEMHSLNCSIANAKQELNKALSRKNKTGPMISHLRSMVNQVKRIKQSTNLDLEEVQMKVSFIHKELEKLKEKREKEDRILATSKRRVSEARVDIEILKENQLQRSKSISQISRSKKKTQTLIEMTPKIVKNYHSASKLYHSQAEDRVSKSNK